MTGPDILAPDPDDAPGVTALLAAIRHRLTAEERAHFDEDLDRWNARYTCTVSELVSSPEWQQIEQWRAYVLAQTSRPADP